MWQSLTLLTPNGHVHIAHEMEMGRTDDYTESAARRLGTPGCRWLGRVREGERSQGAIEIAILTASHAILER